MKQLPEETNSLANCAESVMEVGLSITRFVRAEALRMHPAGLTLGQFRALAYINSAPHCAPSELAEHLMVSRPAVTRLIEQLVQHGLVTREAASDDRRRQRLAVTPDGKVHLDAYYAATRGLVAERLATLSPDERDVVARAFERVRLLLERTPSAQSTP
jgi:DNA-binding MarR family transcriptional regulator